MRLSLLAGALLLLVACGDAPPSTFAEPRVELERLQDMTGAECRQERTDYWFCTAEDGFFHLFSVKPAGSREWLVSHVMLERGAGPNLAKRLLSRYGFSQEDLAALSAATPRRQGSFELFLDGTWNLPAVRVAAN